MSASAIKELRDARYDLHCDPGEQDNLVNAGDPEVRRRAAGLDRELPRLAAGPLGRPVRMIPKAKLLEDLKSLGYFQ